MKWSNSNIRIDIYVSYKQISSANEVIQPRAEEGTYNTQLLSSMAPHAIANFCFGYDKHALHLLIAEKPSLLATLSCHL